MERRFTILIVVALISLVFNIYTVRVLEKQSDEIAQLQHEAQTASQSYNNVSSSLNNLSNELQNLKQGSAWILSENLLPRPEGSTREQVYVRHEVTFREVASNAKVYLQYREIETAAWTKVAASRQGGLFSSTLVLDPEKNYEYQLVEEGTTVRAGAVTYLRPDLYRPGRLRMSGMSSGRMSGNLLKNFSMKFTQGPVYFDFFKIKAVQARVMNGDELVKTVTLPVVEQPYKETVWELYLNEVRATDIFLQLEYADGTKEEMQAWPDPERMEYELIGKPGN